MLHKWEIEFGVEYGLGPYNSCCKFRGNALMPEYKEKVLEVEDAERKLFKKFGEYLDSWDFASNQVIAVNPVIGGLAKLGTKVAKGTVYLGKSISGVDKVIDVAKGLSKADKALLKSEPNSAFFWSGRTEGIGGAKVAGEIAEKSKGTTLESLVSKNNIKLPEYDVNNPASIKAWENASAEYAKQASGEVRAIIGKNLREGNIWENIELPLLKQNQNVTKVTVIDPKTGIETVIFER